MTYQPLGDLCRRPHVHVMPAESLEEVVEHVAMLVELEARALEGFEPLGLLCGSAQERRLRHDAA